MNAIEKALTCLKQGKLVAIPTETVYGLGADATNPTAIQKIYTVKGRPSTNPLIIHLPHPDAMSAFALNIPDEAYQLAQAFWPGPLTLILDRHPNVPKITTGGQETVALRIPNHPITLELLQQFKGGIAAPSANRSGRISPTTSAAVVEELGDSVDYILEGGPCEIGIESTIVSRAGQDWVILREGHISASAIEAILRKKLKPKTQLNLESPGSSLSHYAPLKPLFLIDPEHLMAFLEKLKTESKTCGVLSFGARPIAAPQAQSWITAPPDPARYAHHLYSHLRMLDKMPGEVIVVETPPLTESWFAIQDRLNRASHS